MVEDDEGEELRTNIPEPTYSCTELEPSMQGRGATRIDFAFASQAVAASVVGHYSKWDLVQERHVPQQVVLDMHTLDTIDIL